MEIKFHTLFGYTVITAKVIIKEKTHWFVTPARINKRKAIILLFNMIKKENSIISYNITEKELQLS